MNTGIKIIHQTVCNLALTASFLLGTGAAMAGDAIQSDVDARSLSSSKTTSLGLYLTPTGAHKALTENPEIVFIDVRDPIEVTFVGHAAGLDKIIPLRVASHEVDPATGQYRMLPNKNFVSQVNGFVAKQGKSKSDPIFMSCRSGSRSATAVRMMVDAGYTNVWTLVEGFEGDKASGGARSVNGWKNAGLPWGYRLDQGVAWSR